MVRLLCVGLDFDCLELGELKISAIDWVLEAARWDLGGLEDVGAIAEGLGDEIGSVPLQLKLG